MKKSDITPLFLPDEVIKYLEENRIYNQKIADLIMKYLEVHGEDDLIKYITSIEDGLEAAIKRIEELEEEKRNYEHDDY